MKCPVLFCFCGRGHFDEFLGQLFFIGTGVAIVSAIFDILPLYAQTVLANQKYRFQPGISILNFHFLVKQS